MRENNTSKYEHTMNYGITLKVSGDYALFSRPEMKVERVSYDVMTPSAARGVLEAGSLTKSTCSNRSASRTCGATR